MAALIRAMIPVYRKINYELSDPRTHHLPFMSQPWTILGVLVFYNYFVLNLGPSIMKNRKPFKLDKIIQAYNLVQVAVCVHMVYMAIIKCYGLGEYSLICEPFDKSDTPENRLIAWYTWLYFIVKVVDLLDTVFFVLRKKNSQISFLHVYHHTGMVALSWSGAKFLPVGHGIFLGLINCIVHAVMYLYYFLSNYNSEYKKNIWWKKYITQLQIIQFFLLIVHFFHILFQPSCNYPTIVSIVLVPQNLFMLTLFLDFYKKSYLKSPKQENAEGEKSQYTKNGLHGNDKQKKEKIT